MRALIAGAGRLGVQIADALSGSGYEVTIVDRDDERIAEMVGRSTGRLVAGDACEPAVLEDAGARVADLLVAATGDDEDNLVISLLAKRSVDVSRVAARVNDADNAWLFDERWGVDFAVPSAAPLISLIEEASGTADTVLLLRLAKAEVSLITTIITSRSRGAGRDLAAIQLPAGTLVAAVVREGTPRSEPSPASASGPATNCSSSPKQPANARSSRRSSECAHDRGPPSGTVRWQPRMNATRRSTTPSTAFKRRRCL